MPTDKIGNSNGNQDRIGLAIFLMILAVFLFDAQGAIIKHMGSRYPVQQIAFIRNVFGLVPSIIMLYLSRDWHRTGRSLSVSQWKIAMGRGLVLTVAQFCLYTSLVKLEFATASALAFAGPFFVTTLSIPILGHRVSIWQWTAVIMGFAGILMIVRPGSDLFTPWALLPVIAALAYAMSSVMVRLVDDNVPSATISLYSSVGAIIGSATLMMVTSGFLEISTLEDGLWLMGAGIVGGMAVLAMIMAYRLTMPSNVTPFEYFGIPFSFAMGWFLFGEAPFDKLIPGVFFIAAGGLLIVWRVRKGRS
ncbi:MAG: DMT family transporter [Halopseudomonas aestusnigri]